MKKICFLVPGINAGGIENYLLRFLNYLPDIKNITVVVRNEIKGDLYDKYQQTGVELKFQGVGYANPLKLFKLYKFFKKNNFDVVCDFNGNFAGLTIYIARLAGIKKRFAFYRRSSDAFRSDVLRKLYNKFVNQLVFKNSTGILSNSRHALNYFFPHRSINDNRFKVIYNGIDKRIFNIQETKIEARINYSLPEKSFIIGHVGRFDKSKNHDTVFRVANKLSEHHRNIRFIFCGRGTDSPDFNKELIKYGIENICYLLGLQSNIPLVLKTMDVFYFPSITEGQPNALIEAMMGGLPIITSDIPPIKEVIPERAHNYLISPFDVDKAVDLLSDIVQNKFDINEIIFKGEAIDKFDMNKNFKTFYDELTR